MSKRYELFLEKSGLTTTEAYEFLEMKHDEAYPPSERDKEIDVEFITKLAKEAKEWKNGK